MYISLWLKPEDVYEFLRKGITEAEEEGQGFLYELEGEIEVEDVWKDGILISVGHYVLSIKLSELEQMIELIYKRKGEVEEPEPEDVEAYKELDEALKDLKEGRTRPLKNFLKELKEEEKT